MKQRYSRVALSGYWCEDQRTNSQNQYNFFSFTKSKQRYVFKEMFKA